MSSDTILLTLLATSPFLIFGDIHSKDWRPVKTTYSPNRFHFVFYIIREKKEAQAPCPVAWRNSSAVLQGSSRTGSEFFCQFLGFYRWKYHNYGILQFCLFQRLKFYQGSSNFPQVFSCHCSLPYILVKLIYLMVGKMAVAVLGFIYTTMLFRGKRSSLSQYFKKLCWQMYWTSIVHKPSAVS